MMTPGGSPPLPRRRDSWSLADRRFWALLAMMALGAVLQLGEFLPPVGSALNQIPVLRVHDVHRILFLIPIVYAAHSFGARAGILTVALSLTALAPDFIRDWEEEGGEHILGETAAVVGIGLGASGVVGRLRQTAKALQDNETHLWTLFKTSRDGVCVSEAGKALMVNPAFLTTFGLQNTDQAQGRRILEFFAPGERGRTAEAVRQCYLGESASTAYETRALKEDGSEFDVEVSVSAVELDGEPHEFIHIRDVTERKQAEETIRHLAFFDSLTSLPNRPMFLDHLNRAVARARRYKHHLAVLMLDLDYFKNVNDTLGHDAGDRLLQVVGTRLVGSVREGDVAARMGGDEFMLLLPEISAANDAATVAERILETIRQPFVIDGHELHITTSIGIAVYPYDGEDTPTLTKNADIAMYRAKDLGRNNYQRYAPSLERDHQSRLGPAG